MKPSLRMTADGSHTLFREDLDEPYHSRHGALAESQHVFIAMGLNQVQANPLRILEIGLGTGLNVLLTALAATPQRSIQMTSLEPLPIDSATVASLNYPDLLPQPSLARDLLNRIHQSPPNQFAALCPGFQFRPINSTLENYQDQPGGVDLIYFDAFAPNKQAEVWSPANLQKCADLLSPNGLLVTYCARGAFKRNLRATGLQVEAAPGPPGKREMTRARKQLVKAAQRTP